jgi:putative transposase
MTSPMARKLVQIPPGIPAHITARCHNRESFWLPMNDVWSIMEDYLFGMHHFFGIQIHAFVLMPNHFHLIASIIEDNLSEAMRYFMRETSRWITQLSGRMNQTYGARFHRSLIDSPHYYLLAYKYLYRNPAVASLCSRVEEYPYSSLPGLLGLKKLNIPLVEDDTLFGDIEGTMKWLNTPSDKADHDSVKMALRKSRFRLPIVRETRTPNPLELRLS